MDLNYSIFYKKYENVYETDVLNKVWKKKEIKLRMYDIPINEKVLTYRIERNDDIINEIQNRVMDCRKWLSEFNELHLQELSKPNENNKSNT